MKKQLSPYFLRRAKVKPGKLSEIFNFPRSSRGAAFTSSAPQKPSFQTPAETPPKKRRPFTNHRAVCGAKVSNQVLFMILTSSMLPRFFRQLWLPGFYRRSFKPLRSFLPCFNLCAS
ncbi:hypothetical protein CLOLEP_00708 [[Clostridium] leptum DSM 753]|uniref:Uncharacterized protein n=1 Tax=[Clostridium] leptum DSM 753 TaxID=428125 RepID=A7VQ81_9FIRM|nr:hypothetical protein CLOLEP_00708 [[Clostridium] leptum DSM 753]PEQ24195.1 hypothetical protein CH238_09925 [[Clostridium] leptum DSM 753]